MASVPLNFGAALNTAKPVKLVFGADDALITDRTVDIVGRMPPLRGRVDLVLPTQVAVVGTMPPLGGTADVVYAREIGARGTFPPLGGHFIASYVSGAARPVVNETDVRYEDAVATEFGTRGAWQASQASPSNTRAKFESAQHVSAWLRALWNDSAHLRDWISTNFEQARKLGLNPYRIAYEDAMRYRNGGTVRFQQAMKLATPATRLPYQDAHRGARNYTAVLYEEAAPYSVNLHGRFSDGVPFEDGWLEKYQQAMKPPIGRWDWTPKPPEPVDRCYDPVNPVHLVFDGLWPTNAALIFVCDKHPPDPEPGDTVVVPVKEVYLTINSATLLRLDNGFIIPTISMNMSLDVDSWTWTFSASIPGSALPYVQRNSNGDPVVVQAIVNGTPFNFILENISRDRSFASSQLRVGGRGISAELDAPYAHVTSFNNASQRSARQLMEDVLTFNNIPIGWEIPNFHPTDWLVPAGVFSHEGTYISALNAIVGAVDAYVQPHNTAKSMDVLLRYPVPSWEWGTVTPDFELPSAVTVQEGIEWVNKPDYNRVFVSGQQSGVLGQYTRAGTAGELMAPTVVDPLITHADAARQRGRSIISDTGSIATITLRLPVLDETGIIKPGNFVRYVDGDITRIGMTRGVSVAIDMPTMYQTLTLETHLD